LFVFPMPVEGFNRNGAALLGLHRPIGGTNASGVVIHREEGRIALRGTFPGTTSVQTMDDCIEILTAPSPDPGLTLYAPGVFELEEYLLPENWDFNHDPEDRTHSIDYTITFVRTGQGKRVKDKQGVAPAPQPGRKTVPYGQPTKYFVVADGARTLRAVANIVYGDPNKWQQIVNLNRGQLAIFMRSIALNKAGNLPTHTLPTIRWPIGTKFRYE
jgi:hypothetical protein